MARTINSPGVEIKEYDLSEKTEIQAGTNVLVQGFAAAGPTNEHLTVTSLQELKDVYFGGGDPTNAAERYFYHTCSEILTSPGTLHTVRLPYGADTGTGFSGQYVALAFGASAVEASGLTGAMSGMDYTINPNPVPFLLTDAEYESIKLGSIPASSIVYDIPASGDYKTGLSQAMFFIVNKLESDLDANYQGFYVSFMDQTPFIEAASGGATPFAYDSITGVQYVDDATSACATLPEAMLDFSLSGQGGLTYDMVGSQPDSFDDASYKDSVVMGVYRFVRSSTASDTSKLTFQPKEYIAGSFNPNAMYTPSNGGVESFFIKDLVNKKSSYVEMFTNPKLASDKVVRVSIDGDATMVGLGLESKCDPDTKRKTIGNIPGKMDKALSLVDSIFDVDLDIVLDGGLSTVWAYAKAASDSADGDAEFDDTVYIDDSENAEFGKLYSANGFEDSDYYLAHKTVTDKLNAFCKLTRKDCMFISDPLRGIFVRGADVKVLNMKSMNFSQHVARPIKALYSAVNSNYGATYANWVKKWDNGSGSYVWLPMSGFQAANMCRTDSTYWPWWAPFGLNNGILSTIVDIAIRPNQGQCDTLYKMGVNPVCYFNRDGFAVWGQKTLQAKSSAFDRINVRRLFLTLERSTMKIMRYYIGEPNTAFTRTRAVNVLTPIFEVAKKNSGCYDYKIFCNDVNNTADVIDNNEMVLDIYIKPVRTAEFILVNFYATKTSANFDELFNG